MEQKLKQIIADILGMSEDEINDETSLHGVKAWDSLKHMEIIFGIEEQFEMPEFSMDEIVEMTSYPKIKEVLAKKGIKL